MKIIIFTGKEPNKETSCCWEIYPNYRLRNKILVNEASTRQETDEEFLTRLEIPFAADDNLSELVASINPRYKKKQIEIAPAVYRDETDDEILQRTIDSLPADAQNITVIEHTELPYDGYRPETNTSTPAMRNSWVNPPDTTSPPAVDMVKARQAKMDLEWRPRRNKLLAELDVEYQQADEDAAINPQRGQTRKAAIARDKARLRDMPVDFAAAAEAITDPKELDNFDPVIDIIIQMESV